jgi:hypothetical protein
MLAFTFQTVSPNGSVVHAFTVPAAHLDEARATAQHWAKGLIEGGPEGKDWSGWCLEVLDGFGRCQMSIPMGAPDADSVEQLEQVRRRA